MANYNLAQLLGYVSIGKMIEAVKTGVPNPLPRDLFTITEKALGDSYRYMQTYGSRQTMPLGQYGAEAQSRQLKQLASSDVKLMAYFNKLVLDPVTISQLRSFNSYEADKGRQFLAYQSRQFIQDYVNTRIACTGLILTNGRLGFDANGNLLPDSSYSGAAEQVDMQVPSGNKTQLNVLGSGNVLSDGWQNASADIPSQVRQLRKQAAQLNGYMPETALYGANVPSYLTNNNYVVEYMAREGERRGEFLAAGELPSELMGLKWMPAYTLLFNDQNNSSQAIWGDDAVTFMPKIDDNVWSMAEGSTPVPTTINIIADAIASLDSMEMVYGMFGYGRVQIDPVAIVVYFGDVFLPVMKVPAAFYEATVNF